MTCRIYCPALDLIKTIQSIPWKVNEPRLWDKWENKETSVALHPLMAIIPCIRFFKSLILETILAPSTRSKLRISRSKIKIETINHWEVTFCRLRWRCLTPHPNAETVVISLPRRHTYVLYSVWVNFLCVDVSFVLWIFFPCWVDPV